MQHKATVCPGDQGPVRRFLGWIVRRRRIAAAQMFRGACYSMGSAAVGLVFMWVQHRM